MQRHGLTHRPPRTFPREGEDAGTWLSGIHGKNTQLFLISPARGTNGSSGKPLVALLVRGRVERPVTGRPARCGQGVKPPGAQVQACDFWSRWFSFSPSTCSLPGPVRMNDRWERRGVHPNAGQCLVPGCLLQEVTSIFLAPVSTFLIPP